MIFILYTDIANKKSGSTQNINHLWKKLIFFKLSIIAIPFFK